MRGTLIIAGKEIRSFFTSPPLYVVAGVVCLLMSFVYPIQLWQFKQAVDMSAMNPSTPKTGLNIHFGVFMSHLAYLNFMLILIVPAITMKLLSEEKKNRTFDLLLTSPVSSFEIVFGKYLAAATALLGIMFIALLYPLVTSFWATSINWQPFIVALFSIYLLSLVYAAMNLFCSSLTESGFIAFVLSLVMNVGVWFIARGSEVVDSDWGRRVFEHISLNTHLSSMVEGTLRTNSLVYMLSLITLFVFLSERVVESARWRSA